MLQHYRVAASQYAAIGAAALQQGAQTGDPKVIDAGLKALMKSYANIPDGKDLKLWRSKDGQINFSYKDESSGETVDRGIASPQQLAAGALKVSANGIEPFIIQAAGEKLAGRGAVGGKKKAAEEDDGSEPQKPKDLEAIQARVGAHVDKWYENYKNTDAFKKTGKEATDDELTAMKNVMYHITSTNNLTDDEAFKAAQKYVTAPEPKKGEKAPFKVTKDTEAGEATIKYPDGREVTLPMRDYLPMAAMRGQALADAERRAKEPKKKTAGEYVGEAGEAAADLGKEAGAAAKAGAEAVGGAVGRTGAAVGGYAGQVGSDVVRGLEQTHPDAAAAVRRGVDALRNPNLPPPDYTEDRPL